MKPIFLLSLLSAILFMLSSAFAGDCSKAKSLYEQAVRLGNNAGKIPLLEQSVSECRDYHAYFELAKAYEALKQYHKAEQMLTSALEIADGDDPAAKVLARLGLVYEKQGKSADAHAAYKASYLRHPYPKVMERIRAIDVLRMERGMNASEITHSIAAASKNFSSETDKALFIPEPSLDLYINFEYKKADLDAEGRKRTDELGRAMTDSAFDGRKFVIIGHTDRIGSDAYNQSLSEQRAESVRRYLIRNFSVSPDRIQAVGRGKKELLYHGETEQDDALNRRVQIIVK